MIVSFFLILFAVIAIGTSVATVFGGMAILLGILDVSFPYTVEAVIRSMVSGLDSFTLLAVPLFMLSGIIMAKGGVSEKLFSFFAYFIGNRTARMLCAAVITCMFYGIISGSSPATVSAVGAMTIPFSTSLGYGRMFSTSTVTVAGGLGVTISPSIFHIVRSSAFGTFPSALFIGGTIPDILIGVALMICAYIKCRKSGEDKEKLAGDYNKIYDMGFWNLFKESFAVLLTPVIILGSIYGGIASLTEAVAASVIYALIISIFIYRTLKINELGNPLVEGCKIYVTILFVISVVTVFGRALATLRYPQVIGEGILGNISNRIAAIPVISPTLLVFGMILDSIPNIMILTPIFLSMTTATGMDPARSGIVMTANLATSAVTPSMGINSYAASSMTKIPVSKIARAVIPFLTSFFIALLLIAFIPQLSLWLVGM